MHIIILGAGKVGRQLTEYISEEDNDVVVIDLLNKRVEEIVNQHDVIGVIGNGATKDVLIEAGADYADVIICVTESDELNILAGLMAKNLGTRYVITRVRNPDYSAQKQFMQQQLGINMIINPELESANEMRRMLLFPSVSKVDVFAKGKAEIVELAINENNSLIGVKLNKLHNIIKSNVLICLVHRDGEVIVPTGEFVIQDHDHLYVTGTHKDLTKFIEKAGLKRTPIKNVMIVGGSRIAVYLTKQLLELKIQVKIIENNPQRCELLSRIFPKVTIIQGDGSDEELLKEEGIRNVDAFISLTGVDEENVIFALYAKKLGAKKTVAKVARMSFDELFSSLDLDSVITPKNIIASGILQYIRGKGNKDDDSSMQTLYKIANGQGEAVEFIASPKLSFLNVTLNDLKIKKDILLAAIIRNGKIIVPNGSSTIKVNDHVIVITNGLSVKALKDIAEV